MWSRTRTPAAARVLSPLQCSAQRVGRQQGDEEVDLEDPAGAPCAAYRSRRPPAPSLGCNPGAAALLDRAASIKVGAPRLASSASAADWTSPGCGMALRFRNLVLLLPRCSVPIPSPIINISLMNAVPACSGWCLSQCSVATTRGTWCPRSFC